MKFWNSYSSITFIPRRGKPQATASATSNSEYSMEKIKMSYDKLDFTRPADNLRPHYHSTSTLKSNEKSKETLTNPQAETFLASRANHTSNTSGYAQVAVLTDPSVRRESSRHLSLHGDSHPVSKLSKLTSKNSFQQTFFTTFTYFLSVSVLVNCVSVLVNKCSVLNSCFSTFSGLFLR